MQWVQNGSRLGYDECSGYGMVDECSGYGMVRVWVMMNAVGTEWFASGL